jgi:hypothetical protein
MSLRGFQAGPTGMRWIALLTLALFGCGPGGSSDAGTDGGPDGGDGGAVCTGVPAHLTQYTCEAATFPYPITCEATWAETLAARTGIDCDAGPGVGGHVAVSHCDGLDSVSWVYGFPGDTYQCFYLTDGGAWTGGINYSDRGVFLAGHLADCTDELPPACRDGG